MSWNFPLFNWLKRKKTYAQVHGSAAAALGKRQQPLRSDNFKHGGYVYSKAGMQEIINHEVGSESYYMKVYHRPTWPKGYSGVTIGIGYDLGQVTLGQFLQDWGDKDSVSDEEFEALRSAVGLKGKDAKKYTAKIKALVSISLEDAKEVFFERTVPKYHSMTVRAFPGMEHMNPVTNSVLLSLVYNRGGSMGKEGRHSWNRRREMREIRAAVSAQNPQAIASSLRSMKRLWRGKGQDGLLKRRDAEADLILRSIA